MDHQPETSRRQWIAPLALLVLVIIFWSPWIVRGHVPVPGDQQTWMLPWAAEQAPVKEPVQWQAWWWDGVAQFYPWRLQLHRWLSRGIWPLWNPQQFCGYPFVGNGQSAMFYPPNWIYAFVHPRAGMALSAALHSLLAAWLTFALCRVIGLGAWPAVFGAMAYAVGGPMVGLVPLPTMVNSAAWLPGCLLGVELVARRPGGKSVATLAVCLGMTFLAGHLQIAAYVLLATGLYAAARFLWPRTQRRFVVAGSLVLAGALGLLLATAQLLPSLELAGHSPRGEGAATADGFAFHKRFALQPVELMTLAMPEALGHPARGDYPLFSYGERAGYAGAITLLLAIAGLILDTRRWRWGLLAGLVLTLWAAMGGLPATILYYGVPKVGLAGGFVRLLFMYTFLLAVLGALGLDAVARRAATAVTLRRDNHGHGVSRRVRRGPVQGVAGDPRGHESLADQHSPAGGMDKGQIIAAVAVLVLCAELFSWGWRTIPSAPGERLYASTDLTRYLEQHDGPGDRILAVTPRAAWQFSPRPRALFPPNSATAYDGLQSIQGYDSLYPANVQHFATLIEGSAAIAPPTNGNMMLLENTASPLLKLAGCRWTLTEATGVPDADTVELSGVQVREYDDVMPRAFVTDLPVTDTRRSDAMLKRLAVSDVRPVAESASQDCNRVSAITGEPGKWLVVTNTYYPGWRGWRMASGRPVSVSAVGGVFQAAKLTGTRGEGVELAFVPATVTAGLFCLLLAAGTLAGLLVFDSSIGRGATRRRPES